MIWRLLAIAGILAFVVAVVLGCAPKPPVVITPIDCPQPTAEALAQADPLPRVPAALSTAPGEALGQLGIVIAQDTKWAEDESAKREALVRHGVERCGWTR